MDLILDLCSDLARQQMILIGKVDRLIEETPSKTSTISSERANAFDKKPKINPHVG